MTSLDDLFEQIIHTERRAQERRNFLSEIKSSIQQFKERIKNTEADCICLQGQLASKVQQLNEDDISDKLLQNKDKTLIHELEILRSEKISLENEMDNLLLRKRGETESFCSEVEDFTSSYSLIADGQISREQLARQKLIVLRERFENLKQANHNYSEKKMVMLELHVELGHLIKEKEDIERQVYEVDSQLQTETLVIKDKENNVNSPPTNPEFVRLQNQLDSLQIENLEEECKTLQQEMWRLQQLFWQKQVKERKQKQDLKCQTIRQIRDK